MLIKSLKMKNFRQFAGVTNVDFSVDPEKNVTVILGNNTFGKTTLLQAFNWCFYEKVLFSDNPDDLLNYEVAASMFNEDTETVEVTISLIHDNRNYVISRVQTLKKKMGRFEKNTYATVSIDYKDEHGKTFANTIEDQSEIKHLINDILPEDLSKYFFFDTERVNSISTKKDVADAVKGLLGLSALDNAKKHLGAKSNKTSALGILYQGFDLEGNREAEATLKSIQSLQDSRGEIKANIEQYESEIKYYESRKEQLETILRENQTTAALQQRKQKLEKQVTSETNAQDSTIASYFAEFSNGALHYFATPLLQQAEDYLKAVKVDDKGIKDLTKPTLLEILKRGRCICGCELVEGEDAYNHILEEMRFVPPESIGNSIRNYIDAMHSFTRGNDTFTASMESRFSEIFRSKTRIIEWSTELDEISETIKGKENVANYEAELQDVKKRIKEFYAKKEAEIRRDASIDGEIERKQRYYDSLLAKNEKNLETMQYIKYAEEILEWITATYNEKETYIREALENEVNAIFEKMYHGKRRVVIDNKFGVELLTVVSNQELNTGKSEGLDRVKNFAFIGGLVALAKDKIVSKAGDEEIDLASEPYPLVMDAPFSNADEEHTSNISRVLPEVAEQVIMFVMEKDFKIAEPVMRSKIGKQFVLNKYSETKTELKAR